MLSFGLHSVWNGLFYISLYLRLPSTVRCDRIEEFCFLALPEPSVQPAEKSEETIESATIRPINSLKFVGGITKHYVENNHR